MEKKNGEGEKKFAKQHKEEEALYFLPQRLITLFCLMCPNVKRLLDALISFLSGFIRKIARNPSHILKKYYLFIYFKLIID